MLEHIASGAFGDVYRAWDPQLNREVALKLLRRAPDADAHADEVVNEGRLLARLRHPHIVSVYGAARIDGQVGLWMEFLRGRTLAQAVTTDGALPTRKVAEIGAALCDALGAVHKAGLVHRDVKAQNVMLADDGRVVLMDFGAGGDLRHVGLDMAGTPLYLAPEVARGAPASPQSDVYSLGVLLRYAATGAYSRDVVPGSRTRRSNACSPSWRPLARAIRATASRRPRPVDGPCETSSSLPGCHPRSSSWGPAWPWGSALSSPDSCGACQTVRTAPGPGQLATLRHGSPFGPCGIDALRASTPTAGHPSTGGFCRWLTRMDGS